MAKNRFPVGFNFRAFDNISRTVDKLKGKFDGLKGKVTQVNNKFKLAAKRTEPWRKSLGKLGSRLRRVGRSMSLFVTAPLVALAAQFIKVSSDALETRNKFKEVFKEVDKAARNAAVAELTGQFKLSTKNAQDFLSTTGLIAKGLDLSSEQALEFSKKLGALSQDVASFRNVEGGASRVVDAFNAALVGRRVRLQTLGIVITENDVKNQALMLAQQGVRFETVKQAKALATLAIIQRRTKDDLGDFRRTQFEFANQLRITIEKFDELSKKIGDILMPVAARLLRIINFLQDAFLNLSPGMQKFLVIIAAVAAGIGPLLILLGTLLTILGALKIFAFVLGITLGALLIKFLIIAAAVTALIAIGTLLVTNWEKIKAFFISIWDDPIGSLKRFLKRFDIIVTIVRFIKKAWKSLQPFMKVLVDALIVILGPLIDTFNGFLAVGKQIISILPRIKLPSSGFQSKTAPDATSEKAKAEAVAIRASNIRRAQASGFFSQTTNNARVRVDFNNAPAGTRIESESTGIPPELNLGLSGAAL